jgi:hypothetical protein
MSATISKTTTCQWRWDRVDVKPVTSLAWASRNCVGRDSNKESTHQPMHRRVTQDEKEATGIIAAELHQFVHDAATIPGTSRTFAWLGYRMGVRQTWYAWPGCFTTTELSLIGWENLGLLTASTWKRR